MYRTPLKTLPAVLLLMLIFSGLAHPEARKHEIPSRGLLAYYPFNGDARDRSGNIRHGTLFGTTPAFDRFDNPRGALFLDGQDDYIELGGWFRYEHFSISLWLKPGQSQTSYANIIDNNHLINVNWVVQLRSSRQDSYLFGVGMTVSEDQKVYFDLKPSVWQHLVIIRAEGVLKVYVDGKLKGQRKVMGKVQYNDTPFLRIGCWGGVGRYWNGFIDDMRIYERELSLDEIAQLYGEGK